jgi:hypothetical protein
VEYLFCRVVLSLRWCIGGRRQKNNNNSDKSVEEKEKKKQKGINAIFRCNGCVWKANENLYEATWKQFKWWEIQLPKELKTWINPFHGRQVFNYMKLFALFNRESCQLFVEVNCELHSARNQFSGQYFIVSFCFASILRFFSLL